MIIMDKFLKRTLLIPGNKYYNAVKWGQIFIRMLFIQDWDLSLVIILNRNRKFFSKF